MLKPLQPLLDVALHSVQSRIDPGFQAEIALILGTGLGNVVDDMDIASAVPYTEIQGFPQSTAPGHRGVLLLGILWGRCCAVLQGRLHFYEGYRGVDLLLPVYLLRRLGAAVLVVTNAAGALDDKMPTVIPSCSDCVSPGDIMLIEDHLNFIGHNPLIGIDVACMGERFADLSRAYCPKLRNQAIKYAQKCSSVLYRGIYAAVSGPSLETSAERRMLRQAGAHAVGMSTVPEVIAANQCGMRCLGISAITNMATGGAQQQVDTVEAVMHHAQSASGDIKRLLAALFPSLGV